jgi:serine/threonine protein kinase
MGTPDYMAPEQALDSSQADIRADIYSLGCTLYYLLTGQKPFAGESARARVLARRHAAPTPITTRRDDLPAGLVAIVEKMMAKELADRYQTPAEVVKALAPHAKPAPVAAPTAAAKKPPAPRAVSPVVEAAAGDAQNFLARCPFCLTRIRLPARALGASLPCPHCNSFFTAVPEDEGAAPR